MRCSRTADAMPLITCKKNILYCCTKYGIWILEQHIECCWDPEVLGQSFENQKTFLYFQMMENKSLEHTSSKSMTINNESNEVLKKKIDEVIEFQDFSNCWKCCFKSSIWCCCCSIWCCCSFRLLALLWLACWICSRLLWFNNVWMIVMLLQICVGVTSTIGNCCTELYILKLSISYSNKTAKEVLIPLFWFKSAIKWIWFECDDCHCLFCCWDWTWLDTKPSLLPPLTKHHCFIFN